MEVRNMILVKKEVKIYVVHAMCECGGEFHPTMVLATTYPPQYQYCCDKCGIAATFDVNYPAIEYKEVDQ